MEKKKILYLAVTGNEGTDNYAYSNFIYALCLNSINIDQRLKDKYDVNSFKRHDMMNFDNMQESVYESIAEYDEFVVLLDQYDDTNGKFNSNVWFELGLVSSQNKPILIIANKTNCDPPPFYVQNVNILTFSDGLVDVFKHTKSECSHRENVVSYMRVKNFIKDIENDSDVISFTNEFTNRLYNLSNPFNSISSFAKIVKLGFGSIEDLFSKRGILELLNNKYVKAEFIPGEKGAFQELIKEVKMAKESLRTTRFANQSIVSGERRNSDIHQEFMNALYDASKKSLKICDRIVCNNEPTKWDDILQVLVKSDSKMRVYVIQEQYRTGFELVVIDEKIAFIHFYQIDNHGDRDENGDKYTHDVEVINSTLKLQGETVCKKMANIFDRLHHIDFDMESKNPSRTLLGIPKKEKLNVEEAQRGVFQLNDNISTENNTGNERYRSDIVIKKFIEAFKTWNFENEKDKKYMAIGLALLDRGFRESISNYFDSDTAKEITAEIDKRRKIR